MTKKKKLIIIGAGVVVVGGLLALNATRSGDKGFKVQSEKVFAGDLKQTVVATGRVVPPTQVKLSANVSGRIENIRVEAGDAVKKGQLLVSLDADRYEYAALRNRATLAEAEARLTTAELEWERQQGLHARNLISRQIYEGAEATYKAAKFSVDQMRASLQESEDYLSECTIYSPINGIVTDLVAKEGENVVIGTMNNPGTVIMTISDLSIIEIEAEVDETDVSMVRLGQPVKVELDAFPDTSFKGEVVKIGNSAKVSGFGSQDQATNFMVNVRLIDTVQNVKPGMTSSVDITTETRDSVLQIPIQALVMREKKDTTKAAPSDTDKGVAVASTDSAVTPARKAQKKEEIEGVFVVGGGKAQFREVKTGIADQQYIEIETGLSKDEEIITGSFKVLRELKDGDKVEVDNSQLKMLGGEKEG
jgi:HlyD family secretion protein